MSNAKYKPKQSLIIVLLKDTLILAFWGICQYGIDWLFDLLKLQGIINQSVFFVIQVIFAFGTVIPVLFMVIEDIYGRYFEMQGEFKKMRIGETPSDVSLQPKDYIGFGHDENQ